MVDKHSQSFFGKTTGLTIQSSSRTEPSVFLKFLQKKSDGIWEKPSQGEGKTIKLNLDEVVMILEVLNKKSDSWSSFHSFNGVKTQISFQWEAQSKNEIKIYVDKYFKMLNFAQAEIFRRLLEHMLEEKIVYATTLNRSNDPFKPENDKYSKKTLRKSQTNSMPKIEESIENVVSARSEIIGSIENETDKALLIKFDGSKRIWVPKSGIHCDYRSESNGDQTFLIDTWILKKNNSIHT
ncbi:MAG: hypothetical protein ACFFKA_21910 [Candidatus Thorarchaeota archaeon]